MINETGAGLKIPGYPEGRRLNDDVFLCTLGPPNCGHAECIGVASDTSTGLIPLIIIEGDWTRPIAMLPEAMVGLLSHETIEFLVTAFTSELPDPDDQSRAVHDLIGIDQEVEAYIEHYEGLPAGQIRLRKKTRAASANH